MKRSITEPLLCISGGVKKTFILRTTRGAGSGGFSHGSTFHGGSIGDVDREAFSAGSVAIAESHGAQHGGWTSYGRSFGRGSNRGSGSIRRRGSMTGSGSIRLRGSNFGAGWIGPSGHFPAPPPAMAARTSRTI